MAPQIVPHVGDGRRPSRLWAGGMPASTLPATDGVLQDDSRFVKDVVMQVRRCRSAGAARRRRELDYVWRLDLLW